MSKKLDAAVEWVFSRYIALTPDQKMRFADLVFGFNRAASGAAVAPEPRKPGRPAGSKNRPKVNGVHEPTEATL
jgi:hypothetical protein